MFLCLITQQGNFNSSVGPDGYMLSALTCGMSPVTSITEGLQQVHLYPWYWPHWKWDDASLINGTNIHKSNAPPECGWYILTPAFFFCIDCYYGIISDHRPLLPGQLWQHCTPLHDSEGAVESSWQEGVTNSLTFFTAQCPSSFSSSFFTPSIPSPPPACAQP